MSEILFRGKSLKDNEWVEGYYCRYGFTGEEKDYIIPDYASALYGVEVNSNTIGQFTGLTDKNDVKIFNGDILQGDIYPYWSDGDYNYYAEVIWFDNNCCGFGLYTHKNPKSAVRGISDGNCEWLDDFDSDNWTVIGNIFDNPELITEQEENNE